MSTAITAEHRRRAELRQRALAEIIPDASCVPIVDNGRECFLVTPDIATDHFDALVRKATYLTGMEMHGPEFEVVCPDHIEPGRPDRWDACRKVSVVSALLGRTCGAP